MSEDILDRLAGYRPTTDTIGGEWEPGARAAARHSVFDGPAAGRLTFRAPQHRRRWLAPVAASAAVLAVAGTGAVLLRSHHGSTAALAGGDGTHFSGATLSSSAAIGRHQYAYRADHAYNVGPDGQALRRDQERNDNYVAADGTTVSLRRGGGNECYVFKHSGAPTFGNATAAWINGLPTDPDALNRYLVSHVSGSTSRDEAVFVAVGDLLRADDGLASPKLRAALVDALSRSRLITVHAGVRDALDRPAVRVDFMDQRRRPGELNSLYFDPTSFRLLEERNGSYGQPGPQPGPSFPYSARETAPAHTPARLTGRASIDIVTAEKVVDRLPTLPKTCQRDNG